MTAPVMKKRCPGCPFNIGDESTETAYNLGCLPGVGEVLSDCDARSAAWACHSAPEAVCAGFAEMRPNYVTRPLMHVKGVHL